jgi:hypothetical protein
VWIVVVCELISFTVYYCMDCVCCIVAVLNVLYIEG